jgi:hypothetical protein
MARGLKGKAAARKEGTADQASPSGKDEDRAALVKRRRRLELSRKDVERRLEVARAEAHREMLRRALAALDEEIASLH